MSTKRTVVLASALVISAIVGGTLISSVAAAPMLSLAAEQAGTAAPSAGAVAKGEYCAAFRAAFAAELGITEAELGTAAKRAALTTIDAAVADGDLTQAAADRLKDRIANAPADADACKALSGWRAKVANGVRAALGVAQDALTAAADALGMTPADLRAQLRGGADLKAIAAGGGVEYASVTDAVLSAVKTDLDAAVTAGSISQVRADRILERLADRLETGRLRPAR